MSDTRTRPPAGKIEVLFVVNSGSDRGAYEARYTGDTDSGRFGISTVSPEAAIADLHETETWRSAQAARAAQSPEQKLMQAAADLTEAVSRLGWRFRSQPVITPDGDVEMTLYLDQENSRQSPVMAALLGLLGHP